MNPITKHLMTAIEPIIDAMKSLRDEIDAVRASKVMPDPQEIAKAITADAGFVASIKGADGQAGSNGQPGNDGQPGAPGADGQPGQDGAGIETRAYVPGEVYREGTIVTANIGQYFKALKDTVASTDDAESWQRIGTGGHRHVGTWKDGMELRDGDLVRKDYGTFCQVNGQLELYAGRGAKGETGLPGKVGPAGKDGRNGSTIIAAETKGFVATISVQNADESIDHIVLDFTAAFNEAIQNAI